MNLDELAAEIEKISPEPDVHRLAEYLRKWKLDRSTVTELSLLGERYLGHTWLSSNEVHAKVYSLWSSFKSEAINGISGMTMNERLWYFGLFSEFDRGSKEEREIIYAKLLAPQ